MKQNTLATLGSDGFLGGMKIDLEFKDTKAKAARPGYVLSSAVEKGIEEEISAQVAPLKKKAEDLIGTIDSVLVTITAFWDESTADNLSQSVAGVKRAIFQFERTAIKLDTLVGSEQARLGRIFRNVESITENLKENNENITKTLDNISVFSDEIKDVKVQAAINQAEEVFNKLNIVVAQINSGDGTLGNLIYNDSLHTALLETNATLQLLVNDIRNYPNRYLHFSVFGSREKTPRLNSKEEKELKQLLDLQKDGKLRRFSDEEMKELRDKVFGN